MNDVVSASRDQVAADLADETIILGMKDGIYYGVDGVAARIWSLVQQPVALADVVRAIVDAYDVDEAQARADVLAFVASLESHGLVTRVSDGAP